MLAVGRQDVAAIRDEIAANSMAFGKHTFRQDHQGSAHGDTRTIYLRMCQEITPHAVLNDTRAVDWDAADFPLCMQAVTELARGREIGRVMVIALAPSGHISPHADEGEYPAAHWRYHLPVSGGSSFRVGERWYRPRIGTWYWMNNRIVHEVHGGPVERIHLVADLR